MEISLSWSQDEEGQVVAEDDRQWVYCRHCEEVQEITETCDLGLACPLCGQVM